MSCIGDLRVSPAERNVRVVVSRLGDLSHLVDKIEGFGKIREFVTPFQHALGRARLGVDHVQDSALRHPDPREPGVLARGRLQDMTIAGGSLFQVIVPLVFFGYFAWRRQFYSAAIVALWVGQSIINVYVYAADAVVMQLVLTSGFTGSEGSFHDWNYLLTATGLLSSTKTVAGIIRFVGTLTILGAGVCSIYYSLYGGEAEAE